GAEAIARGGCEALKTAPATAAGNPAREGMRLLTEAQRLWSTKDHAQALRAAEAAYALDPTDASKRDLLARYLITQGGNLLHPGVYTGVRPLVATSETVAATATVVRR